MQRAIFVITGASIIPGFFSLHFAFHAPQGFHVVLLHYDENKKINKRIKTATTTKILYDLFCKTNKEFTVEVMGGFRGGEKVMEAYDVPKVRNFENLPSES